MTLEIDAGWKFDNSYTRLSPSFFTKTLPTPFKEGKLVIFNESLATELGLHDEAIDPGVWVGLKLPKGAMPIAQAYGGHQFGHFTMLGDGRAVLLGEQLTPTGERFDIQLKGAGRTPYSRGGDGLAALGPMLREYIISEAMHGLGIPTTRSLAVAETGEVIMREKPLPGAVLTRVAKSHLRVGTFEYASQWGTVEELKLLADYAIERHFSYLPATDERYLSLLREVVKCQATLIAKWQLVGFVHGVMNTDNMTISGETIDYGPCAFMDVYDPDTVFSSIDRESRYAYGQQPQMAAWNLARLAESLLPLIHEDVNEAVKLAQEEVTKFWQVYRQEWLQGMRGKLGFFEEEPEDELLIEELLELMKEFKADYTNTFRSLTIDARGSDQALFESGEFASWYERWQVRLCAQEKSKADIEALMKQCNPAIIPRNYRVEDILEAATNHDFSKLRPFLEVIAQPYAYSKKQEAFAQLPKPTGCRYQTFCGT